MRVFRGLDHKNYYTWSAIAASKEDGSPSPPPKKKLQGRPRIHSAVDVRRIGEQMATGQLPSSGRRAAADLNISNRTLRRIIGERQEELGLRPVTRKRRTKLSVDKNWPRVLDMQLSFIAGQRNFLKELDINKRGPRAYSDEFPIKFGEGDGGERGYCREGDLYVNPEGYRDSSAHAVMCVSELPPRVIKFSLQDHAFVEEECYKFYAEAQATTEGAPLMNGPALTETLGNIGVRYFLHDMWGRAVKTKKPTKGHFHPDIHRVLRHMESVSSCLCPRVTTRVPRRY